MSGIKTFFLEPIGIGTYHDDNGNVVGRCTEAEYGVKFHGRMWSPLYRRLDTGEEMGWYEAPAGAQMYVDYGTPNGPDGKSLAVKLPGNHTWHVDSMCSNCDMKDDKVHRCWIRHGDPRQCNVTVDKQGNTCKAGAGSILIDKWHGFLTNGELIQC